MPDGSILSPSNDAAVVGGNVLTSQRLCDVILHAFNAVAASQGLLFKFIKESHEINTTLPKIYIKK